MATHKRTAMLIAKSELAYAVSKIAKLAPVIEEYENSDAPTAAQEGAYIHALGSYRIHMRAIRRACASDLKECTRIIDG